MARRPTVRRWAFLIATIIIPALFLRNQSAARAEPQQPDIPRRHEQLAIRNAIVAEKLQRSLLPAMRDAGIDMWIVIDRENNADPLHDELGGGYSGPGAAFLFFDGGGADAEKIYLGQEQPVDSPISRLYDHKEYYGGSAEDLARLVRKAVQSRKPRTIAVNTSPAWGSADGVTASGKSWLDEVLGPEDSGRIVSAEQVVHGFRARRTPLETMWFTRLQVWTSRWETRPLEALVRPGKTTVLDLVNGLEDAAGRLGLDLAVDHGRFPMIVWFGDSTGMPGLSGFGPPRRATPVPKDTRDFPIEPGDLITLDGGLRFLGFSSDMKRSAYVARPGETDAPATLLKAWHDTLAVADLFASRLVAGANSVQIWNDLLTDLRARGFDIAGIPTSGPARPRVTIYAHSTGNVVHEVGARIPPPAVGTPATMALPLIAGEFVSVEFHLTSPATEANGGQWFTRFEQTAQVGAGGARWLIPRQERPVIIKPATTKPSAN